ncbi:MAG: ATP-dependent helicase UvrD/PcrA [Patescibacteria group bacterium]|nr:ATP-dependent helicase UvrD/PcrA [Patescibacteria group bacterium]
MPDFLSKLNPDQQEAVLHREGPAIVLAGAGSGKTTVLTHRAAWLIKEHGVLENQILLVTFTNKAAGEMKERIENLTGSALPWAGTFHSLSARMLRHDGHHLGLDFNYVIYDSDDQLQLIKDIYKERGYDAHQFKPSAVKAAISKAKNDLETPTEFEQSAVGEFATFVARVYKLYQRELTKANAVDFDDLLLKSLQLLKEFPEIRNRYQELFRYVLVDEYQDTNKVQYQLTQFLTQPQNNLYVVGDFSQSIYAWRGADYRNMLQLKTDFESVQEYRLEQNYRSTQTILDAATHVISHNKSHPVLKLWTTNSLSQPIMVMDSSTGDLEAAKVVDTIRKHGRTTSLDEIAILYRTNAQSRLFEEALIRNGIPYKLIGGTKFYERKEVKDVLAYARVLVNPLDSVSYNRIGKLGKRRLEKFDRWRNTLKQEYVTDTEPHKLLEKILEETEYMSKFSEEVEEERQRLENVQELVNMASQFDNLTQFLENIALLQDNYFADVNNPVGGSSNGAVQLMSLHSAKGLEFEVVFLVGMEDGFLPHSHSLFNPEGIEEERRLCYVGITRAKQFLYFSFARSRYQYGSRIGTIPSRFLADIPESLLHYDTPQLKKSTIDNHTSGRRIVVDEDMAEDILRGDLDIEVFLES